MYIEILIFSGTVLLFTGHECTKLISTFSNWLGTKSTVVQCTEAVKSFFEALVIWFSLIKWISSKRFLVRNSFCVAVPLPWLSKQIQNFRVHFQWLWLLSLITYTEIASTLILFKTDLFWKYALIVFYIGQLTAAFPVFCSLSRMYQEERGSSNLKLSNLFSEWSDNEVHFQLCIYWHNKEARVLIYDLCANNGHAVFSKLSTKNNTCLEMMMLSVSPFPCSRLRTSCMTWYQT